MSLLQRKKEVESEVSYAPHWLIASAASRTSLNLIAGFLELSSYIVYSIRRHMYGHTSQEHYQRGH